VNLCAPPLHFGRRPPQSNCPPATVHKEDSLLTLADQIPQGGVPLTPKLPPTLYSNIQPAMTGCSKAPWGLFVLRWVMRIFTHTTISPSLSLRQRPSRYAIRAGRNLPDKEFRYLRTVIVTAAIHQGFDSSLLKALLLTFWHWAGVSPYTSPFGLAETCVFGKQSLGPLCCGWLAPAPLLPKLRGYFA
jgi:hypothetical protein